MKREIDFAKFSAMMIMVGEATQSPSPEKIEIYFRALSDMEYSGVEKNAMYHLRFSKFFPTIPELRKEENGELEAQTAYALIESLVENFLFPGFQGAGMCVIEQKLQGAGKKELIPLAQKWGPEIAGGSNPTATRAQFLKSFKAEMELSRQKQIMGKESVKLPENVNRYLEGKKS